MAKYPFPEIEKKWQEYWETNEVFKATEDPSFPPERRRYVLDMFPYPSAAGLHVGHPEGYTATDIYCRYLRMKGYNVLHPMGFDSFGLPAEQYAIKTGTHPRATTEDNINQMRAQIKALGLSYDWSREISTHKVDYYRWTQWIFLQLYRKGLAYMAEIPVWYCEALGTVLANEEVLLTPEGPRSERGSHPVERKPLRQWMLRITAYAERLLEDLEPLEWPESIKAMQRNWIGRSEGANVVFPVAEESRPRDAAPGEPVIEVFTTRPDTLFGATYMVLAPEHPLVSRMTTDERRGEVEAYVEKSRLKSDLERTDLAKEKTGAFTGAYATNPVNAERIPVWISDYILLSYGTGAIMAVPAHDQRDFEFAETFGLPILPVVQGPEDHDPTVAFTGDGVAVNSGQFDGLTTPEFKKAIITWLEKEGKGTRAINYKLRDWIFSRQRYWGEPIPVVHCGDEIVPLSNEDLPLTLPEVESYQPSGTGESPLAKVTEWVDTTCPTDGGPAKRETNTMPQWAGSCWYFLRFLDARNTEALASREAIEYWMPVDLYVGGAEHAVLHLLYARFWHKVLYDIGVVNTEEPFLRLVNQGMILGPDGQRMSKSRGNVINPDDVISEYGADTLRLYEMFMGPLPQEKPWSVNGIMGVHRFLDRVWRLSNRSILDQPAPEALERLLHKTIKKVEQDTNNLEFNTAISQMMVFVNEAFKEEHLYRSAWERFVLVLGPYAPHLAEELWEGMGNSPSIAKVAWPEWDPELVKDEEVEIVIQINGKVRSKLMLPVDLPKDELQDQALAQERIREMIDGRDIRRIIVVPNRLVNIVL